MIDKLLGTTVENKSHDSFKQIHKFVAHVIKEPENILMYLKMKVNQVFIVLNLL